jgi:hypothetical protein
MAMFNSKLLVYQRVTLVPHMKLSEVMGLVAGYFRSPPGEPSASMRQVPVPALHYRP